MSKKLKPGTYFNVYFPQDCDEIVLEYINKQKYQNKFLVKIIQEHIKKIIIGQPETDQIQIDALQKQVNAMEKAIMEIGEMLRDKQQAPSYSDMDKTLEIIMKELTAIKKKQSESSHMKIKIREEKEPPKDNNGKKELVVDKNLDPKDIDWKNMF